MLDELFDFIKDFFNSAHETVTHVSDPSDSLLDALLNSGIDLSHFSPDDLREAITTALGDGHVHPHPSLVGASIPFTGLGSVSPLADAQIGPTCGFEAIENFIQLNNPSCPNTLSTYLQKAETLDGGSLLTNGCFSLNSLHYQHILADFGISTEWHPFSHETLMSAIYGNKGILAVGDAHYLNGASYPNPNSYHAFMITDTIRDVHGKVVGYKGLDSNFSGQEFKWSTSQIEEALEHGPLNQGLLISAKEMNWPIKTT